MDFLPPIDLNAGIVIKLVLASALGGLVGLERELRGKPAGLRTNMFICAGSALFTILSQELASRLGGNVDATRIASQLIPGIGFIGAGSIIRARGSVTGLTTAATIFVLASIGMAVGGGLYWTAVFAALMMFLALWVLGWLGRRLGRKSDLRTYRLEAAEPDALLNHVLPELERRRLGLQNLSYRHQGGQAGLKFDLAASPKRHQELSQRFISQKLTFSVGPSARGDED